MKQFLVGLVTIIVLIVVALAGFRGANTLISRLVPSPSITPSALPSATPTPSSTPKPSYSPEPSAAATTKGGLPVKTAGVVKGVTTQKVTTTTTSSHLSLTLVKTSVCPISYLTEVKDIQGPLTFKYELIDNTSFGLTVWNKSGEELLQNTTYGGRNGTVKTFSGVDYLKVRVESKTCASNNDNWLKLTAER